MEAIEIKTRYKGNTPQYKKNLNSATIFMRHSEDRITAINGEMVQIEIYENGDLLFCGDKYELFEILKKTNHDR